MAKQMNTETLLLLGFIAWSLSLPFLPNHLFKLIDNIVGVLIILLVVLLSLPYGAVVGVVAILAVALTFVERNRRKIKTKILNPDPNLQEQLKPAPPMREDEVHPGFDVPDIDAVPFVPSEESGSNEFHAVDTSLDEKQPIPTISSNTDTAERFFIEQDLGRTELAP
jgi:hypothetical protein